MITLPAIDVERLVADRRDLHAHPELAFQEFRTSALVSKRLTELGYRVRNEVGRTGVLGVGGQDKGPTVLLRADMDALPVHEANDVPYRSTADGPRTSSPAPRSPSTAAIRCRGAEGDCDWLAAAAAFDRMVMSRFDRWRPEGVP